ncbi:MAG: exodeoxyribonuclease VII large subunit [Gemmatimonadales bacterium]|nr:MAG: exodeoxyribonuclease VII large subunit [Gemmatimonadales bacterium]
MDLFSAAEPSPEPEGPRVWTVSEINGAVRALLEEALPEVQVAGEVANWTRARSGHCYFTLKDDGAQLRSVMWRGRASRLPMDPEEGFRVRATGTLTLYEARGEYQLNVRELEAEGEEGLWKLAFEKLRKTLMAEGLLDPARRRPIPTFPRTVGVVTSPTGAALRDILSVIGRRAPWTRVVLRGARVQGEGASLEVARALQALVAAVPCDVVIVGRGGGSIEDLWAFNEEPVARAIAGCPVPVISAVGHETDVTIADLVADLRAPTPSAAAEAAVADGIVLREALGRLRPRLARGLRGQVERRATRLGEARGRMDRGIRHLLRPRRQALESRAGRLAPAMRGILAPRNARVERALERLGSSVRRLVELRRAALAERAGQVEALSPLSTLRRGYAVPLLADGRVVRTRSQVQPGDTLGLRLVDGRLDCTVDRVRDDPPPVSLGGAGSGGPPGPPPPSGVPHGDSPSSSSNDSAPDP